MTTTKIIGIASLLLPVLVACGENTPSPSTPTTPAEASSAGSSEPKAAASASSTPATASPSGTASGSSNGEGKTYRFVVSFTSIGTGVDAKAKDQVNEVINKWRIARGYDLKAERPKWGREGESDICADLTELTEQERTKFIADVRTAVGKNDRVTIAENASCHTSTR